MKLSALPIYAIGLMVGLIALFWGLFQQYLPNMNDVKAYNANTDLQNAEAAKQSQADKRVKDAYAMVKQKDDEWKQIVATRTPPDAVEDGGIDLNVNAFHLAITTQTFRNNIQRAVNQQLVKGGVKVIEAPFIPQPDTDASNSLLASFYNYPAVPFPVVVFDLGQITVTGTYSQIMDNMRAWKSMPHYLAVADGLALSGTSPHMVGTYNVSIIGFIRAKQIYPAVPEAGGGGASAGGSGLGGGFGGFGGGPTGGGAPAGFGPRGGGGGATAAPPTGGPGGRGGRGKTDD